MRYLRDKKALFKNPLQLHIHYGQLKCIDNQISSFISRVKSQHDAVKYKPKHAVVYEALIRMQNVT